MIFMDSSGFLLINGKTLQQIFGTTEAEGPSANPIQYQVTFETTHDDAVRTQSGDMPEQLPTIITRKVKVDVQWNKLKVDWLSKLIAELNLVYPTDGRFETTQNVAVTYRDMNGSLRTINTYVSPTVTGTYVIDVNGQNYWDGVRIAFIEK